MLKFINSCDKQLFINFNIHFPLLAPPGAKNTYFVEFLWIFSEENGTIYGIPAFLYHKSIKHEKYSTNRVKSPTDR